MRRPLFAMAAFFTMGIAFAVSKSPYIAVSLFLFIIFFLIRKYKILYPIFFIIFFIIGSLYAKHSLLVQNEAKEIISDSYGKEMTICGKVVKKEKSYIYLNDCYISINQHEYPLKSIKVNIAKTDSTCFIGDTVITKGKLSVFDSATNEGCFDEALYYRSLGITGEQTASSIIVSGTAKSNIPECLYRLKTKIRETYCSAMEDRFSGVAYAMITGDKGYMDSDEKELYQLTGMGHILAVSGLHISIVGLTLFGVLRRLRLNYYVACSVTSITVILYLIFTGGQISAIRAGIGLIMIMLGYCTGKTYDPFTGLGVAAVILLLNEPLYITNTAFQLSFMAICGVDAFLLLKLKRKNRIVQSILLSISIMSFTLPVLANTYHCVHPVSIILNLFILPTTGPLLVWELIMGLIVTVFGGKVSFMLLPVEWMLHIYHWLMEVFANIFGNGFIIGSMSLNKMVLYYLMLVAIYVTLIRGGKSYLKTLAMTVAVFVVILFPTNHKANLQMLDVGQGDGIYIHTSNNKNVFIDGGSSDVKELGKYVICPFLWNRGVRKIDYWFVSHTDEDHTSGLRWMLENGFEIDTIFLPSTEGVACDESADELISLAINNGTQTYYFGAGDSLTMNDVGFYALYPCKGRGGRNSVIDAEDKNGNSLVLLYQDKEFSALFTGDIGTEQEDTIVSELEKLKMKGIYDGKMEMYKCAHHGSKYSNSYEFLQKIAPELAVVSCGRYNNYGHPSKEAINSMKASGAIIKFTMYDGQISVIE